jgi:hypothetical protein
MGGLAIHMAKQIDTALLADKKIGQYGGESVVRDPVKGFLV